MCTCLCIHLCVCSDTVCVRVCVCLHVRYVCRGTETRVCLTRSPFRAAHRAALAYLHQGGVAAAALASHPELVCSLFASAADLHDLGLTVLTKVSVWDVARGKYAASISVPEQVECLRRARKQVCVCMCSQNRALRGAEKERESLSSAQAHATRRKMQAIPHEQDAKDIPAT